MIKAYESKTLANENIEVTLSELSDGRKVHITGDVSKVPVYINGVEAVQRQVDKPLPQGDFGIERAFQIATITYQERIHALLVQSGCLHEDKTNAKGPTRELMFRFPGHEFLTYLLNPNLESHRKLYREVHNWRPEERVMALLTKNGTLSLLNGTVVRAWGLFPSVSDTKIGFILYFLIDDRRCRTALPSKKSTTAKPASKPKGECTVCHKPVPGTLTMCAACSEEEVRVNRLCPSCRDPLPTGLPTGHLCDKCARSADKESK